MLGYDLMGKTSAINTYRLGDRETRGRRGSCTTVTLLNFYNVMGDRLSAQLGERAVINPLSREVEWGVKYVEFQVCFYVISLFSSKTTTNNRPNTNELHTASMTYLIKSPHTININMELDHPEALRSKSKRPTLTSMTPNSGINIISWNANGFGD